MNKVICLFIVASVILSGCAEPSAATAPQALTFGIDHSGSSPVVTSPAMAKAAGRQAARDVARLPLGSRIVIRNFGARTTDNIQPIEIRIDRRNRPRAVAGIVQRHFENIPSAISEAQNETNILAFLEFGTFDCAHGERITLFTDGIEASKTISDREFLSGKPLPAPKNKDYLKGCEVVFFGLGHSKEGLPPRIVEHLRSAWQDYFAAAGAKFTAIIDP